MFKDFFNCARHCWCAYSEEDPVVKQLGAELLVRGMKATPHEHGIDPEKCMGCLLEAGKVKRVLGWRSTKK